MNPRKAVTYVLCLSAGGALALVVPRYPGTESHASHAVPELLLSEKSSIHEYLSTLCGQLEDGSARLDTVLDTTSVLLDTVQFDMRQSQEEVKLPLVWEGEQFGYLRMPAPDADGIRQWIFEITLTPTAHCQAIADFADLSIAYFGIDGNIKRVTALSQATVHRRAKTIEVAGSKPYVIGGVLTADVESSSWGPLTMTVEIPKETQTPLWTTALSPPVPGGDSLKSRDLDPIAGLLFSL